MIDDTFVLVLLLKECKNVASELCKTRMKVFKSFKAIGDMNTSFMKKMNVTRANDNKW